MFRAEGSVSLNSSIFRFVTALEKDLLRMFAFFHPQKLLHPRQPMEFSQRSFILPDNDGFAVLQNCNIFFCQIKEIIPFSFLLKRHTIASLFTIGNFIGATFAF